MKMKKAQLWRVLIPAFNEEWTGEIVAWWEVSQDPISDDYTPYKIEAEELLRLWAKKASTEYPDGLIPIYWSAIVPGRPRHERMPFQHNHHPGSAMRDFFTDYDWPVNANTGEPLNWLSLPVVDKYWNESRCDTGGFIQEATEWKPSILQPYVFLDSLLKATGIGGQA